MAKVLETIAVLVVLVCMFFLGRMSVSKTVQTDTVTETVVDTLWMQVHDTTFTEVAHNIVRLDTVFLEHVTELHDTVRVTIPIENYQFEGENYRITAEGYAVRLRDVWINYPTVTTTVTNTVTTRKRWAFSVGAQIGYGYTIHGASPYAGIGVGFGYTF